MKVPADHIGKATASHDEEGAVNKDAKLSGLSVPRLLCFEMRMCLAYVRASISAHLEYSCVNPSSVITA